MAAAVASLGAHTLCYVEQRVSQKNNVPRTGPDSQRVFACEMALAGFAILRLFSLEMSSWDDNWFARNLRSYSIFCPSAKKPSGNCGCWGDWLVSKAVSLEAFLAGDNCLSSDQGWIDCSGQLYKLMNEPLGNVIIYFKKGKVIVILSWNQIR